MPIPNPSGKTPRQQFVVAPDDNNRPLGDFVARACPTAPVGFLNRLIRKGLVLIDGKGAKRGTRVRSGQQIVLCLPSGARLVAPNPGVQFGIVHEDSDILIVNKPAGVVSEPGIGHKLDTLLNGLMARYGEELDRMGPERDFGMVHRLDRDASGLLAVARKPEAYDALRESFRTRTIEKRYRALVLGDAAKSAGRIEIPLGRVRRRGRAVAVIGGSGTRPARTDFRVLERFGDCTLVEASPRTGRWRQLRLHFGAVGHPVAGDAEEGDPARNEEMRRATGLSRLFLHAAHLAFDHPGHGRRVAFDSPLPPELEAVLSRLRSARKR